MFLRAYGGGTLTTIAQLVDRASLRFGERIAVVDGERHLSFREVGRRSNRLANALQGLSPSPGSRIAVLLSNRLEFVEIDFAIAKAGKVKTPINPRLSDNERQFILSNSGADVVFTEAREIDRIESMRPDLPNLRHIVSMNGGALDYEELLLTGSPASPMVAIDPEAPSMILHTSGTTGRPKGATTSQSARIAATSNMLLDEFSADVHDVMIHAAPMSHGSGSKILAYFVRGARNVVLPKFEPELFFQTVARLGGTSTFVVPTMIQMLLNAPEMVRYDLSGIRNISYGGAPMPFAVAEVALATFGPVLTQVYGSCEAPHPVTVLSARDHVASATPFCPAGHEVLGVSVRITGDDGDEQPIGDPGELWVRGPNVMSGYWEDETATDAVLSDGWYRTGDVATRGEDGLISIVGRIRDMLISGGLNVYPAEVEAVLQRHDAVSEVAVFGTSDDLWGEVVTAAIVLRPGKRASEEMLIRYCASHLADYKKPRHVIFVDELPKGVTGKVLKDDLKRLVAP